MSSLREYQEWMQDSILNPEKVEQDPANTVHNFVKASSRLSAKEHFGIYQRSYTARLRECMATQFTALEYALGKELFSGFADAYLQQYPSISYTLADLGDRFSLYLEETRPDKFLPVKEDWPDFMIELIELEYSINLLFDKKEELAEQPQESIYLNPLTMIFAFKFPISRYYRGFKNGQKPELPVFEQSWCAIVRKNYQIRIIDLNETQYHFLHEMVTGKSIENLKPELFHQQPTKWEQWKNFCINSAIFFARD